MKYQVSSLNKFQFNKYQFSTTNLKRKNMFSSPLSSQKRKYRSKKGKKKNEKLDCFPYHPNENFGRTSPINKYLLKINCEQVYTQILKSSSNQYTKLP